MNEVRAPDLPFVPRWARRPHPSLRRPALPAAILPVLIAVLTLSEIGAAQGDGTPQESPTTLTITDLPVTRVVLFTSGVGYFEHSGTVTDDAELLLSVPEEAMNDMLQSLVLQDLGGGTIRPVRYASRDPLGRILSSYTLDLSDDPTLAELISQARGQLVEIETSARLSGRVINVERVTVPESEAVTYLTLATSSGLQRIDLAEVRSISFADSALQSELESALAAIASNGGNDDQPLRLRFEGEGERHVSVGYVREMPVWKSSYRLLLGARGESELQGWAIFDNPTAMDLQNVSVSFKAGRPVSFVSTLFEPIYLPRQRVDAARSTNVTARAFEADSFAEAQADMGAAAEMRLAAPAAAPQPSGAGVSAMAQGAATGATFEYRVEAPVTVGRFESAMIPIVATDVEAHLLSIYDPQSQPLHPLRGVRLQNDTGLHLAAGPVSVFDQGGFTGNALIGDIVPGDSRMLAYAVDLDVEVTSSSSSDPEELVAVAIRNGVIETSRRQRLTTRYRIDLRGRDGRFLVIEHPRRQEFEIVAPTAPPATTPQSYRLGVLLEGERSSPPPDPTVPTHLRCEPDSRCELSVTLERDVSRSLAVSNISSDQIAFYLENVELTDVDRQAFNQILELKRQLADLDRRRAEQQARVDAIHRDQGRIRQNMAQLDRNSSLYRRYLTEMEAQEDELATLTESTLGLEQQRQEVQVELDDLVDSL